MPLFFLNNQAVCINKIANSCSKDDRHVSFVASSPKEPKCCFHVFEIQFFVSINTHISYNRQELCVFTVICELLGKAKPLISIT